MPTCLAANTKEICDRLNAQQGSSRKWLRREIDYILMNERYAGNAIFQKKYTRAELPRTVKRNHGERAMYYVSDSNAPIIPQNVFDRAAGIAQTQNREQIGRAKSVFWQNPMQLWFSLSGKDFKPNLVLVMCSA